MPMTPDSVQKAVQHIHNEQTLLAFLRDDLQWTIDDDAQTLQDATYRWSHDDLQLDETRANIEFRQLKPFVQNQWAGIFIVKFPDNTTAYKTALRKALRGLVTKKRGGSAAKTWELENLFFICTPNYKDFTFAHYSGETPYKAKLATFAWEYQSPYLRTLCEYNLPNLALPDSLETDAWRNQWLSAFDVEKVTEKFFQDFETAFQTLFAKGFGTSEKEHRIAALTTLNRLMFLYFIQKKNWLNDDGNYLTQKLSEAKKKSLNFYNDILKRIYFEFLSVPLHERNKRHFGQSAREIHSLIGRIPFLNGGLFEQKPFDNRITFTNEAFERIFGFFQRYHFTVAENTPLDIEVAVDPEMLGKVFESLIGEERKQKGMFYTPASVVSFMCKESLLQFLRTTLPSDAQALETFVRTLDASLLKQPEAVLQALSTVKILDPACGSGAFLLGMLHELLSLRYALFAAKHIDQKTIYERKKDIIEQTLHGVDIDPFAVEMAQFRLWLSLAVDFQHKLIDEIPALPNLDFKIRTGDSLVAEYEGVSFHYDPTRAKGKKNRIESALKKIVALQHNYFNANTADEKHTLKSNLHRELRALAITELTERLKSISIQESLLESDKEKKVRKVKEAEIAKLNALIADLNTRDTLPDNFPLLWEVDFANVINEGGFDIVIGNPPYIQLQRDGGFLGKRFANLGFETFERTGDIYSLFYEQGIKLLKEKGHLAYITSNKWMRAGYGKSTRVFFLKHNPIKLLDLGGGVFGSATVDTNILIIQKEKNQNQLEAIDLSKNKTNDTFDNLPFIALKNLSEDNWTISNPIEQQIREKIERIGKPLKEWDIQINYGIKTGYNEAFIIDGATKEKLIAEDPKSAEIIKPLLRGRDIRRYKAEFADLWLIATFPSLKINIDEYPAVKRFLKGFKPKLKQEGVSISDADRRRILEHARQWNITVSEDDLRKSRKKTGNKWFETQDQISYYQEFEKEKIIYIEIQTDNKEEGYDFPCFQYNKNGAIVLNTGYIMTGKSIKYILSILNSSLGRILVKNYVTRLSERQFRMLAMYVEKFPIPMLSESEQKPFVALVEQILAGRERGEDTTGLEREIDLMVYGLYGLTAEEIAVVETSP